MNNLMVFLSLSIHIATLVEKFTADCIFVRNYDTIVVLLIIMIEAHPM
jgi:hypothetical protein